MEYLNINEKINECEICFEDCNTSLKCCNVNICFDCYLSNLMKRRECPRCQKDQMSFDVWVEEYKEFEEYSESDGIPFFDEELYTAALNIFRENPGVEDTVIDNITEILETMLVISDIFGIQEN